MRANVWRLISAYDTMWYIDRVRESFLPSEGETAHAHALYALQGAVTVNDNVAKEHGAVVCVDNSIMAPIFQRPIDLGADISMTSATKVRRPRSSAHSNYPSRLTVRLSILPAQVHRGPL